jgi:hypothetical protein
MNIFDELSKLLPIYIIKNENDDLSCLLLSRINNINIIDSKHIIDDILIVSNKIELNDLPDASLIVFNNNYNLNPEINKKILNKFKIAICTNYNDMIIEDDNIINVGCPYQLNKDQKNRKGFLVVDHIKKKYKFIDNNFNSKFIELSIKNINDISKIEQHKNDFLYLFINEKVIEKKENLNKLNIVLNKYNIKNIMYIKEDDINLNNNKELKLNDFNIKKLLDDYLNDNNLLLKKELEYIYKLNEK